MSLSDGLLMPYGGAAAPLLRDSKRAVRVISREEANTQQRLAGVDMETDVSVSKGSSVTRVTATAMQEVTGIAQLQTHLETQVPGVSGRLEMLANFHLMSATEIAADHQRRIRRR